MSLRHFPHSIMGLDDMPSESFSAANTGPTTANSSSKNYVTEFNPAEAPIRSDLKLKSIPPFPTNGVPIKKIKNLPNLPSLKSNGENYSLQFEVVPDGNPDSSDSSMAYGLNLRKLSGLNGGSADDRGEEVEGGLPEDTGIDEYTDMPVEGFGATLLSALELVVRGSDGFFPSTGSVGFLVVVVSEQ
ncbi:protein MOS2 [Abeliophyllum distichum]|uniref:Protein MOS2 n=1 Tax=Abeliophyllum distichum TaxID=126358 RepID=A0ABD1Q2X3_9LAMI